MSMVPELVHARPAPAPPIRLASNAVVGTMAYLGTVVMFFGGLISVFLVLRAAAVEWPPANQPRLPILVTGINTGILLLSGLCTLVALRLHEPYKSVRWLHGAALLGCIFVIVQGFEWVRLIQFGLSVSSGTFASTFYAIVGAHAIHVLGGLLALIITARLLSQGRGDLKACSLYWGFVVLVWPAIYALVYLS